ncbi:GPI biosynthesis protein family Pig-F-domain-containing protein [Daedaleopsis nitida]|nr:GPI biosynthesis protein family Pig-F-domain-containing protein [Daedaleopsis nitida]
MPSRTGKSPKAEPLNPSLEPASTFPFARYTSIVGVHTSLLAFSALILPGTSLTSFAPWVSSNRTEAAEEQRSRDISHLLTESPLRTVAWICVGAFIVQSWWAGWIRQWSLEVREQKKDQAEATQKKFERKEWKKQRVVVYAQAAAMTFVASFVFYVITVLFGAPYPLETYSMSLLLAVLTVLPPAYTLGSPSFAPDSPSLVNRLTWTRLFAELSPRTPIERALVYPAAGAVTGCWLGAIPIGLDWERPWQAWPLTPTFGAVGGSIVGSLVALVVSATLELAQTGRQNGQPPAQIVAGKYKR